MAWKRWVALGIWLAAGMAAADEVPGEPVGMPVKSDEQLAQEDRIAELERIVDVLADELERTRESITLPEEPELKALYGRGPGAARIYGLERGLHIGGYGETIYTNFFNEPEKSDRWDNLRTVLYVGYRFSDRVLFNSEIEFEHATTSSTNSASGGSVSVEFANLDFLLTDWANTRIGMMLVPMGFLNQMHEPPFFYGALRPEPERRIIPSTWRENGGGLFGSLFGGVVEYESYAITGLNAAGFDASGLRGGRQKGNRALAEDFAWVGRLDWYATDDLLVGGSVYVGQSGQNQTLPDSLTKLWELHADFEKWGIHLRGLFTMAHVSDAGQLTTARHRRTRRHRDHRESDAWRIRRDRVRHPALDHRPHRLHVESVLPLRVHRQSKPDPHGLRGRSPGDDLEPCGGDPVRANCQRGDQDRRAPARFQRGRRHG